MDLTLKYGLTAGWGATAVNYQETQCDWTQGITDVNSVADVLKKIEGVRLVYSTIIKYVHTYVPITWILNYISVFCRLKIASKHLMNYLKMAVIHQR